jgi:hypothetical protein
MQLTVLVPKAVTIGALNRRLIPSAVQLTVFAPFAGTIEKTYTFTHLKTNLSTYILAPY